MVNVNMKMRMMLKIAVTRQMQMLLATVTGTRMVNMNQQWLHYSLAAVKMKLAKKMIKPEPSTAHYHGAAVLGGGGGGQLAVATTTKRGRKNIDARQRNMHTHKEPNEPRAGCPEAAIMQ